jgi:heme-degrading monooxygenase HmoA
MVEVNTTWDFLPGMDQDAYAVWSKRKIELHLKAPGFVEFRANRNLIGQPQARATSVWETMADAASFLESADYLEIMAEGLDALITNTVVNFWGTSPMIPEPLRPHK